MCAMASCVLTSVVCCSVAGVTGCERDSGTGRATEPCGDHWASSGGPCRRSGSGHTARRRSIPPPDTRRRPPQPGRPACAARRMQADARPSPSIDPSSAGGRDLGHSTADRRPTMPRRTGRPRPPDRPANSGLLSNKVSHRARLSTSASAVLFVLSCAQGTWHKCRVAGAWCG